MEWNAMAGQSTIHEFLCEARVPFAIAPNHGATQEAISASVFGQHSAKVVVCVVDGKPIVAMVPVPLAVHLDRLLELAGGREIRVADDLHFDVMARSSPMNAEAVFVDVSLVSETEIVFSAGTDADVIAVRWADFARAVKPIVGKFAGLSRDRVPAYHLSARE
jgi:prolyl-tRNA editing enzyme YbaK/EbsC (Cys-tRNA(Pro) deacylase)